MKKNLKQALVPLAVMVFGAAAAFATNAAKQSEKAPMDAYHYDISKPLGERCVKVPVNCQNGGSVICTYSGKQVWASPTENNDALTCTSVLYRF